MTKICVYANFAYLQILHIEQKYFLLCVHMAFKDQQNLSKVEILFYKSNSYFLELRTCLNIYTPGIYAEGYIVFVFPFVCLYVHLYFRHVCKICVKVLRQSFSSGVYLSNYLPESIHIWTIVTLEGWHSLHDPDPRVHALGWG